MNRAVILCVDDEEVILTSLESQLRRAFGANYQYELAESADDALEILEDLADCGVKVLVIISDWLMPGMKGDELLTEVYQRFPHVATFLLSGQADEDAIARAMQNPNLQRYLQKPWNSDELIRSVQACLV